MRSYPVKVRFGLTTSDLYRPTSFSTSRRGPWGTTDGNPETTADENAEEKRNDYLIPDMTTDDAKPTCRLVGAGEEFAGKQGHLCAPGISAQSAGAQRIHLQMVKTPTRRSVQSA